MKKTAIIAYLIVFLIFFSGLLSFGQEMDLPKPTADFFVNDFAGVLSSPVKSQIQNTAVALQEATTAQVVVVTIDSLEGGSLEEYAVNLFRSWGIGTAEKNNGVLMLISIGDRVSRIEVGYGLEGALPDGKTGRIQDEFMIPHFQSGDYSEGIQNGFLAIVMEVYHEYGIEMDSLDGQEYVELSRDPEHDANAGQLVFIVIGIVILLMDWIFLRGRITRLLLIVLSRSGRGGGFGGRGGGGFGGGGGFSGGGGRSGGGGSSRGW